MLFTEMGEKIVGGAGFEQGKFKTYIGHPREMMSRKFIT